ncbi:PfkB family carbohydrate kinase [Rhodopirellula maiorica SM1]|uniref:PfkB family carbohydrate kinase n=1 Tax=Rhodopirellula maiorica SM1 TaxID=1265738 RepID=M5RJU8_9BACT|nr:carbohydrate kinase family protein [Rhodopirellula maiorica]EMI15652.1 PfkB family carbohydrate kinase [Rhodopirellula maiorica SM1]
MQKRFDVLGIGVSVLDAVMVVDGFPAEETVVRAQQRAVGVGGGVAVATATAGALGGRVAFADLLGIDPMSESILAALRAASVDVTHVRQSDDQSASLATIWVNAASASRTIVFSPASERELPCSDELEHAVAASKILHLNGRHLRACSRAIEVAKQHGTLVSFDGGAHRYRSEVLPLVQASDILIVSEHFAFEHFKVRTQNCGKVSTASLVEFLQREFPASCVGVTCGEQGSWIAANGETPWHQAATRVDHVRDTTGCGDTYHGAFLWAWTQGRSVRECAKVASIVAAQNATELGAFAFDASQVSAMLKQS